MKTKGTNSKISEPTGLYQISPLAHSLEVKMTKTHPDQTHCSWLALTNPPSQQQSPDYDLLNCISPCNTPVMLLYGLWGHPPPNVHHLASWHKSNVLCITSSYSALLPLPLPPRQSHLILPELQKYSQSHEKIFLDFFCVTDYCLYYNNRNIFITHFSTTLWHCISFGEQM